MTPKFKVDTNSNTWDELSKVVDATELINRIYDFKILNGIEPMTVLNFFNRYNLDNSLDFYTFASSVIRKCTIEDADNLMKLKLKLWKE